MDTLIIGGDLNSNIYAKIGAVLALPNSFTTYVGFGLSSVLAACLAIKQPLGATIEMFLAIENFHKIYTNRQYVHEIKELIKFRLGGLTFEEFYEKHERNLVLGTYNLTTQNVVILSRDHHKHMKIVDAIELCITIPGDHVLTHNGDIYCDVSLVNSVPLSHLPAQYKENVIVLYSSARELVGNIRALLKIISVLDGEKTELRAISPNRVIFLHGNFVHEKYDDVIARSYLESKSFIKSICVRK